MVEMNRPRTQPIETVQAAQTLQRRKKLKELLVTQLAKQFGATSDPNVRAVIVAEAERALAKGKVVADDIRELERNIRRTLNLVTTGTFEGPRAAVDAGNSGERINWGSLYEFKKLHGDQAELEKLQQAKDARNVLNQQIKHQMAEKEAARRRAKADEEQAARAEKADLERREADERARQAAYKAKVQHEVDLNKEHMRLAERRRQDEAHLRKLEDERMLSEMRSADEAARIEKARQAVEKAKRLELVKLQDARSLRLKQEQRAKEDEEQRRLDAVWKEILDDQERKREQGLRAMFQKQAARREAYGKSTGAELAERARLDELNMLRWQKISAEQQEERERRDKQKLDEQQRDILGSLTSQLRLAEQRREEEVQADRQQAAIDAENIRVAKELEQRLRAEQRRKAIAYQGELATHARLVKQSQLEGALNENFMSASDKSYNSNLVRAVIEQQRTGRLLSDVYAPLG